MKNIVPSFVSFLLGIALATLFFINQADSNLSNESNSHTQLEQVTDTQQQHSESTVAVISVTDKDQLIEQQAKRIRRLSKEIESISNQLNESLLAANSQPKSKPSADEESELGLRTMNMQTFEESMKTQFTDQFKGIVLQLEGQRLEDIKQSYNNSSEKNEWSNQYENSIANFLATNDENGDHYLQSLNCNTNVCRLEVNTNDADNWNRLYAKMTNESWYQSITVQEKSDYPGNVIYYLPSLNN